MMRPSVAVPTGTLMPAPVFVAIRLRLRPSVEPSAIVRTMPSPSCCCTSSVIGEAVPSTLSASYTFGTDSRGNSTSTTAPMIWTTLPWLIFVFLELNSCVVQLGEAELLANQAAQRFLNFAVSRYRCLPTVGRVQIDVVPRSVSQQHTASRRELADQRATVHLMSSNTGFA